MKNKITDTNPRIEKMIIEGYRKMSPLEKLRRVDDLTNTIKIMALTRIRKQYNNLTEREEKLRLASLWLDRETMIKVFNWDPLEKGY